MKKLSFIIASLIMVAFIVSCEKESMNDDQSLQPGEEMSALKAKPVFNQEDSWEGVTPVVITGENNGGNVTCSEVENIFEVELDLCGDKNDYYEEDGFAGEFPAGLTVTVNEEAKTLSFDMEECILIGDEYYKVGAVIVKGGRAANVYLYDLEDDEDGIVEGISSDGNLTAPEGKMISNVTFCFVECEEEEELIIAIKFFYYTGSDPQLPLPFATSTGEYEFSSSTGWCTTLGVRSFVTSTFELHRNYSKVGVASIEINGEYSTVTINLDDGRKLYSTYIFIGTQEELFSNLTYTGCPDYRKWKIDTYEDGVTPITIPL